jgi:Tfp pilus assembly protein PilV
MDRRAKHRKASALVESLIALTIFAIAVLASLEFFGTTRKAFFKLRDAETAQESAQAALDKMRADIFLAGRGLIEAMEMGIVAGIEGGGTDLTIRSVAKTTGLLADGVSGQKTISILDADGMSAGKEICLINKMRGEAAAIASVVGLTLTLNAPLTDNYPSGESRLLVLEKIAYSLDPSRTTIKRKVNASSAQPLLEGVASFVLGYAATENLASVCIAFPSGTQKTFSLSTFPKNMALARRN